jgi:hypothetical protein
MVAEDHQIQPSLSYFDNLKSSSSNYNRCIPIAWGATFQVVEQNIKINEKSDTDNQRIVESKMCDLIG